MSDLRQQPIPGMRQPDAPTLATEADAVARLASRAFEPRVVDLTRGGPDAAPVLLVPAGMELKSIKGFLDQYLPRPVRRAGTTLLTVYQREDVLAQALRELADHIAEKTGCPVYLGEAPAPAKT